MPQPREQPVWRQGEANLNTRSGSGARNTHWHRMSPPAPGSAFARPAGRL